MKIYFAGSIRGGRERATTFGAIVTELKKYGDVLTEHVGGHTLHPHGENLPEATIYKRDMDWIRSADVFVAEVTSPSLGVGYEIANAEALSKPILCLYEPSPERRLSGMLVGNPALHIKNFATLAEANDHIKTFFQNL